MRCAQGAWLATWRGVGEIEVFLSHVQAEEPDETLQTLERINVRSAVSPARDRMVLVIESLIAARFRPGDFFSPLTTEALTAQA